MKGKKEETKQNLLNILGLLSPSSYPYAIVTQQFNYTRAYTSNTMRGHMKASKRVRERDREEGANTKYGFKISPNHISE